MRKLISLLTNRLTVVAVMFLLQIAVLVWIVTAYTEYWYYLYVGTTIIGAIASLHLIASDENPMYKLIWIMLLLVVPVFGVLFYLYARSERLGNSTSNRMKMSQEIRQNELRRVNYQYGPDYHKQQNYLTKLDFPVYQHTESTFLPDGKTKQKMLLQELKEATQFIFMEYFIITASKMWDEILAVLIKKQKEGVEIRIMYDDFGSAVKLPYSYHHKLKKLGFKVVRFNPMKFHITFSMNYRDHRKIVVIDNKVAFTGGFNIGDEYTNKKKVFGYWNDAGIMVKGEAVWSFTVLFLENWGFSTKEAIDFSKYQLKHSVDNHGSYLPFGDIPADKNLTAKNTYLHLINDAKESLYITAPYLILDNEISTALKLAAQSGISVNIIIPNIPDKKLVYMVSESYVEELIGYGVNVYKFTPGFIHSKMIICDKRVAMIGTSNLDFRSLYMHLENNLWLDDQKTIHEMNSYIEQTLKVSQKITADMLKKRNILYRILQAILRGFSPLL